MCKIQSQLQTNHKYLLLYLYRIKRICHTTTKAKAAIQNELVYEISGKISVW